MDSLDVGSIVIANMSIGTHPAIVLSTKEEIAASGMVVVVAISANTTISLPEDLIEIPRRLGMTKGCFVQCGVQETIALSHVVSKHRKAYGPFLESVQRQVQVARDRVKKSSQS